MKTKILLILFVFLSIGVFAQNEKGRFFAETGVKAFGGGDFLNFVGKTGFSFNRYKWQTLFDDGTLDQEGTYNGFSWAVAPRLGYRIGNHFKTGIDFQYYHSKMSYGVKYGNFTSGLFFRFDFTEKKIIPFIELTSGFGLSKELRDSTSPGGAEYQTEEQNNLFYYSGSAGVTFVLSGKFNLNLSARIQNTVENEIQNNNEYSISYINERAYNLEVGPMLSVTYIFNKKKEKN